ncbi:hypothetical protein [Halorussus lipolyticus]|uniref:hypothetical protein n=1 Tax=Halorussus lipolyticus TaxID=3034024 RepID=UPI0023E7A79B|nr:hypothetical protein [Halorussus sp. DT80]
MSSQIDALVAALEERVGDGLRGVFYGDFREREYSVAYADDGALEGYSVEEVGKVIEDVSFEKLHSDRRSDLHEPLGRYTATVEVFDDGINLVVVGYDDAPTIFVGIEGDVANVTPALEAMREVLD